ncbi:MAG: hypothetical protein AAB526_03005 [Patescibacteria group bacterium]
MFNFKKPLKNNIQIASFLINDPKLTEIWGNIYIVEPSNEREAKLGQLIVFAAISDFSPQNSQKEIVESIIKEIQSNYYGSNANKEESNIEEIFETTLQKTNQDFAKIIRVSQNNWFKKVNMLIAVIKNESVYFVQIGSLFSAFLIHDDKIIDIVEKVRINNIPINPLKLFSSITSGSLSANDNIFFTSLGIFDFISSEKIKKIINDLEVNSAILKFKNLLSNLKTKNILIGTIVKNVPINKKNETFTPNNNPLFDLVQQKEKTEKILRPSLLSKIQKNWTNCFLFFINHFLNFFKKILTIFAKKSSQQKRIEYSQKIKKEIPNAPMPLKRKKIFSINNYPFLAKLLNKFKSFPFPSKVLLIISLILALFFIYSLIWLSRKQTNENIIKENNQLIETIENKQNAVGAALIYKDENKAKKNLEEILKLSERLPKNSTEDLAKYQKIQKETEIQLNKLRGISMIENPSMITDLNLIDSENKNFNIILLDHQLYFYNQERSIFKFNFAGKKIFSILKGLHGEQLFKNAKPFTKNSILFSNNINELIRFDSLKKKLISMKFQLPTETKEIEDFVVYSQKIYLLDAQNNQIYKYSQTQTGLGEKSNWLKNVQINLKDSISMAIDGSVYILKSNGEILKFLKGEKQEFALKNLEPKLTNPTKIWTDDSAQYIYILEPSTKRMIIANKQGGVQKQYTSDKFAQLQNFAVDEKKNKLYILSKNKVYELKIE